ncbi:MAG: CDP-glycerol glycerophosphotransferase family protein [Candidatus Taylorbacteria bacterium]|nr:CDP-glycerol glycerophosphotransferase family protein [Candidatus Taylorbacteria bacterium]
MELIRKNDFEVQCFADAGGRGADILKKYGFEVELADSIEGLTATIDSDVVAVFSTHCSVLGRDVVNYLKNTRPTFVLQDAWGGMQYIWSHDMVKPRFVFVNDQIDANTVSALWPDFLRSSIIISGYPALDSYFNFDVTGKRAKVFEKLGLNEDKPVILLAGQWWHSGELAAETVAVLNELGQDVYFIPRVHPAMKDNTPEELPVWNQALADFRSGTLLADTSSYNIQEVLAAASIVVSMYSTTLMEAAVLRKQNISVLYPNTSMASYHKVTNSKQLPPLVQLRCSSLATNREELKYLIKMSLSGNLGLEATQKICFKVDGQNAKRVADFAMNIIR